MITLLAKIFIKNHNNYSDSTTRTAYGTLCAITGIILNFLLFVFKLLAGMISGSVAVTADAVNNLSDSASSVVTLMGFKISAKKPDADHPFGHGRSEHIAGLIVSFFIILMGFELAKSSFSKLLHPEDIKFSYLTVLILVVSVAVKLYMTFYNRAVGKKICSPTMYASATDSISDSISTAVVLLSMLFYKFTSINIDPYCGILVSLFVFTAGIRSALETISPLLGEQADPKVTEKIESIVMSYPEALGIHDMIVHNYGNGSLIVSLHVEVSADGDILTMHDAIDNMEKEIGEKLCCLATIHMDPVVSSNPELDAVKEAVCAFIDKNYKNVSIHDFRMVKGQTHTNIIFDVVIPFDEKDPSKIVEALKVTVNGYNSTYFAAINVDRSY
ncbi:MAG: cation transporter [Clostridia bacterium]|nr:cation transporter [Clostridia bacterium]